MPPIVLVNLGSPVSSRPWSVYRYLTQFLTDPLVIEKPWLQRQLLVRAIIAPVRCFQSAKSYKEIWMEEGAPLLVESEKVRALLEESLRSPVYLAMRYQKPSLEKILKNLKNPLIVPLFPQYADATTGSIIKEVKRLNPFASFVNLSPNHPKMIQAMASRIKGPFDHVVMSFHGLPVSQDRGYRQRCEQTAKALSAYLSCSYSIAFQSRLGKDPWLEPYLSDVLTKGSGRWGVISPSFVCDCLETLFEIGCEYKPLFSGELSLIPCMNDHPLFIESLKEQILEQIAAH